MLLTKVSFSFSGVQLAQAFPGLVSRLKEFLPEIPLFQPSDDSGTPEPDQKILRYDGQETF